MVPGNTGDAVPGACDGYLGGLQRRVVGGCKAAILGEYRYFRIGEVAGYKAADFSDLRRLVWCLWTFLS